MTEIKMNELVPTDDELLLDYRKLSPFYLAIYKIVSGNSNFCSFIAGMIAGIPAIAAAESCCYKHFRY